MTTIEQPRDARAPETMQRRLLPLLAVTHATWMLTAGVSGVLVPAIIADIDESQKVAAYGLITAIAAVVALLSNIVFGAASDRTRWRWGRRRPWIIGGAIIGALGLGIAASSTDLLSIAAGYLVFQAALNAFLAPLVAIVPDRVPAKRRGAASSAVAFGALAGQGLGAVVGGLLIEHARTALVAVPWIWVLAALVIALMTRDTRSESSPRASSGLRRAWAFARSLTIPRDRDFLLALTSRLMMMTGMYAVTMYQLYILTDYIGADPVTAGALIATFGLIQLALGATSAALAGPISDRLGRRRIIVAGASVLLAAAMIPMAFVAQVPVLLGFVAAASIAYGAYQAVDTALMTEVLPNPDNAAKDMGILNISNTAAHVLGPVIASSLIASGLGYPALFLVGAALIGSSAILVLMIRRVA
ncbi:MFS transporter [Microbacterium esteraromaticum]|uniref:MFS transporter n=1 Tax=Microbacterium esteraromaticum TaxID=57043 RepID=UPI003C2B12DF